MMRKSLAVVTVVSLLGVPLVVLAESPNAPTTVPLINPVGADKSGPQPAGLFRKVVTARGFEIDDSRTGFHDVRAIGATDTFPSDAPEIYVVIEFLQSAFDIFRLVGRFILEDPGGKPVGTLLHTDKAQFENEDTGGYLVMKRPPGGFPVGNYRVEIHYENVTEMSLLKLAKFKVVPAAGAAGQKP
ncbi:MAG TPA: hypothetical protein VF879_05675 [Nitrospirales bacterium]